ncbi:MAG: ABC transporter substrate-binding protein [Acidimicrobiales bacterium]|jgi:iron complex transport system substrate-binding protein
MPLVTALAAAAAVLFPGAAASAASGTAFPVKVRAANGSVSIPARPTAIVSLSPTATEMLYAIGAGSQVKAVDEYSDYPPSAPHTNLDGDDPNVEAIASYKPDLVVLSDEAPGVDSQLGELGIPVLSDPAAANLAQEYAQFMELGEATGHEAQASAEVAKIKGQISAIVKSVHKSAKPLTYYYELDQTYYSATSSTFIGQVLGLLGLRSIADAAKGAAASGGYPQLSGEFILKSDPRYIFLADTICCGQSPATVAARPGWSDLTAVKDGRVLKLNDDIASRWGPRIVILLSEVAAELQQHPAS